MHYGKAMVVVAALGVAALASGEQAPHAFPDYGYAPPRDWTGPTFELSQAYPKSPPPKTVHPWELVDFRSDPQAYLAALIDYCFEGNEEVDFVVQKNARRTWYHAPWLHYGANGREFVRGLTRERTSRPYELAATQTQAYTNFAVGFYSPAGGSTLGRVWANPVKPDPARAVFPEGTVACKLLFTTAPSSAVDYLAGSPEWVADVNRASTAAAVLNSKVRLLQIDVAVKDRRSMKGGWVFGTFHYDASLGGTDPWRRLRPLSLMWGDDPTLTPSQYAAGARPTESWINAASPLVRYRSAPPPGTTPPSTMGWAGRANGPVDNPASSCMSCHSSAQIPASSPMIPPRDSTDEGKLRWFRNLAPGVPFDAGGRSLDYSLQVGVGITNLAAFKAFTADLGGVYAPSDAGARRAERSAKPVFPFTRDP
jgi:hypothetical protein